MHDAPLPSTHSRPDSLVYRYDDPVSVSALGFPASGYKSVYYRVLVVDSLGRPSDTSAVDSLFLAVPPFLSSPVDGAVGKNLVFSWEVTGHRPGYLTQCIIYSDTGIVATGPQSGPWFDDVNSSRSFSFSAANIIPPLESGSYGWGVLVSVQNPAVRTASLAARDFYVP